MSTIYSFVQCRFPYMYLLWRLVIITAQKRYSAFDRFTLEGTDLLDKQKIPCTVETVWTK